MDKIIKPFNQLLDSKLSDSGNKHTRSSLENIKTDGGEF